MSRRLISFLFAAAVTSGAAAAIVQIAEPPDSLGNLVSGVIETADTPWSGTSYDIRHVINPGGGRPLIIKILTTDSRDDLGPRMAVNPVNGDSLVAWWRRGAIDEVIVRRRINATGVWTAEKIQSVSGESSRHPSIAFDSGRSWIAYEAGAGGGPTMLEAKVIEDDPAPFGPAAIVATTSYTGSIDAHIHAEYGRVWLTWVDSATGVGWCRYDASASIWGAPHFEPYDLDSVAEARGRIRSTILAN
jgi:hypothetical protein